MGEDFNEDFDIEDDYEDSQENLKNIEKPDNFCLDDPSKDQHLKTTCVGIDIIIN